MGDCGLRRLRRNLRGRSPRGPRKERPRAYDIGGYGRVEVAAIIDRIVNREGQRPAIEHRPGHAVDMLATRARRAGFFVGGPVAVGSGRLRAVSSLWLGQPTNTGSKTLEPRR